MTGLGLTAAVPIASVSSAALAAAEDVGKAGPVGLFLIVSLLVVVFFLGRSMRTHLRRVPLEFPPPAPPEIAEGAEGRVTDGVVHDEGPETPRPRTP